MGKEFSTIVEAIEDVRQGKMIVIVDDEDRENEGDLMIAAEKATPELINFMARFGRGLICLTLTEERTKELGLSMMVEDNQSTFETPFTVSSNFHVLESHGYITQLLYRQFDVRLNNIILTRRGGVDWRCP